MASPKPKAQAKPKQLPIFKIGPLSGGISVAVWNNEIEGEGGEIRIVRGISISPRRYLDRKSGEWRSTNSFRPNDLSAIIMALQKAQEYCITTPSQGEHSMDDRMVDGFAEAPEPVLQE